MATSTSAGIPGLGEEFEELSSGSVCPSNSLATLLQPASTADGSGDLKAKLTVAARIWCKGQRVVQFQCDSDVTIEDVRDWLYDCTGIAPLRQILFMGTALLRGTSCLHKAAWSCQYAGMPMDIYLRARGPRVPTGRPSRVRWPIHVLREGNGEDSRHNGEVGKVPSPSTPCFYEAEAERESSFEEKRRQPTVAIVRRFVDACRVRSKVKVVPLCPATLLNVC